MAVPLVTIIVPSYNQGRFIGRTLDSIFSQDYRPLEVIVVDGASRDHTVDVLKQYDGREGYSWVSEPDKGVVDAVNKGLLRAQGSVCGIQSSDDCYLPGAITQAMAAFADDPSLLLVYSDAEYIDAEDRHVGRTQVAGYSLTNLLSKRTFIMQSSAFFRTATARALGGWRPEISYVADNDLWLRMALQGPFRHVPGLWSRYRLHEEQRDSQAEKIVRDWNACIADLLPHLDANQRRAARLGCHFTAHRYARSDNWWMRTRSLYAAVATDPTCISWPEFPRRELLQPLRQVLSRCKRFVLGRPLIDAPSR